MNLNKVNQSIIGEFLMLKKKLENLETEFSDEINNKMFEYCEENNIKLYANISRNSKIIKLEQIIFKKTKEEALESHCYYLDYYFTFNDLCQKTQPYLKFSAISFMNFIVWNKIKKYNPEIYDLFDKYYNQLILTSKTICKMKEINQKIFELIQEIKKTCDKNKIATEIYKYYYNHLDEYIEEKPKFDDTGLIEFFINKHNIKITNLNIGLDYLQWYWEKNLYLISDFNVELKNAENDIESDIILKFFNKDVILTIIKEPRKYTGAYYPKYKVIKKYLSNDKIIDELNFNKGNYLLIENYYSNLIDFIFENLNKIN